MQRYSLLFIGFFISTVCFGQTKTNTDKIKSIIVTEQKYDGSASKTFKDSEVHYDVKGNIIEEKNYKDGKFDFHFKYEYDAHGNKLKEIEFNSDGKVKRISTYKYQGNLRIEKVVTDEKGNLKSKKTYKYEKY